MPPVNSKAASTQRIWLFDRLHEVSDLCKLRKGKYKYLASLADSREIMFKLKKEGQWSSLPLQEKYRAVKAIKQRLLPIDGCEDKAFAFWSLKTPLNIRTDKLEAPVFHGKVLNKENLMEICNKLISEVIKRRDV